MTQSKSCTAFLSVIPQHIRKFSLACRSSSRSRSPTPAISPKQTAPAESILPPPPGRDAKQDAKQDTMPEPESDSRSGPKPELKQEAKQDAKAVSQEPAVKAEPAAKATSPPAKVPLVICPTLQIMQCSLCESAAACSLCLGHCTGKEQPHATCHVMSKAVHFTAGEQGP